MKKFVKIILILISIASLIFCVAIFLGTVQLSKFSDYAVPQEMLSYDNISQNTEFYYFEGFGSGEKNNPELIVEAYLDNGVKYKYTSYGDMPQNLIDAFISIEDKRFYRHNGIDLIRLGRAVGNYLAGGQRFGGSTITQQLVKNVTGHDEISIERKIKEAFAALKIERDFTKEEILESYLNVINLSNGCRGVGAAAEYYFSKQPQELSLAQCATIAAITNNPSLYNPIKHPENCLARRNLVLECMLNLGFISQNDYKEAIAESLNLKISNKNSSRINSWYIDMVVDDVIADLCEKYDLTQEAASLMLYKGGYKIYTAMDKKIQSIIEEYFANEYNFPIDRNGKMAQSAMIIIDPYTGDILGVAGAVGEKQGNRLQNFATKAQRPPGSTIKPLSVYAPAIDNRLIEWSTVIEDSPITEETANQRAWPQNVDRTYVGNVDIKYAIEHSLNTVAVKVLHMVGNDTAFNFLQDKLHFTTLNQETDSGDAALALGQPSKGVTLKELTGAYSIFEEGIMSKPRSYYKVCDENGIIILDNSPKQETVISKESAAIMTKLLESVVDTGTASGKISLDSKISVAGKSGTSGNCCDRYFIGYTPEILAGVWFGYDYPQNLEDFGGNISVYIWDDVIGEIYERCDLEDIAEFSVPNSVQKLSCNKGIDVSDNDDPKISKEGWFNVTNHKTE